MNRKGFTVIEIVAVLIIFSVLSAVVMERLGSMDLFKLKSTADAIESNLRYVQMRSMTSDEIFGVEFSSEGYAPFSYDTATTAETARRFPGTDYSTIFADKGVSFSIDVPASGVVSFDSYGKPFTDKNATTVQVTSRFITLSSGGESVVVEITEETGFMP